MDLTVDSETSEMAVVMSEVGVGAINEASAEFTWSGQEGHRNDGEVIGYEWFLSGEGSF